LRPPPRPPLFPYTTLFRSGEPQLAFLRRRDRGAGLEVLGLDAELPGEEAERLHRRYALAVLDPRDVRVRDSRAGDLALRQAAGRSEEHTSELQSPDHLVCR